MSPATPRFAPAHVAAWLVVVPALLHLWVAGRFDLGVDEAHYALYGAMPALSYFDHPPLVGWLQGLVLQVSDSELALRFWPIALGLATAWMLYRFTRTLFPGESAWVAVISVAVYQSGIMFQLLALGMVPETPLLLLGLLVASALYRAVESNRTRDWLWLGVWVGLAGLAKYTAVTLVATALIYLALRRRWGRLAGAGPWLAVGVAGLLITPVLVWNYQHDWVSFVYQLGHGAPDRAWGLERFLAAQGYQFAAYSPGIYLFGLIALVSGLRHLREPGAGLLIALGGPVLLLFGWGAGFEEGLPHWTALGWLALAPLSARWIWRHRGRWPVRWGAYASAAYSLILIGVIHSQFFSPWVPFRELRHPLGDLYGWREAAAHAATLLERLPEGGGEPPALLVGNWSMGSRIAWYGRPHPVRVADERFDQFDLWYGAPGAGTRGVLIVPDYYRGKPEASGLADFERCREQGSLTYMLQGKAVHAFDFYFCKGYRP